MQSFESQAVISNLHTSTTSGNIVPGKAAEELGEEFPHLRHTRPCTSFPCDGWLAEDGLWIPPEVLAGCGESLARTICRLQGIEKLNNKSRQNLAGGHQSRDLQQGPKTLLLVPHCVPHDLRPDELVAWIWSIRWRPLQCPGHLGRRLPRRGSRMAWLCSI